MGNTGSSSDSILRIGGKNNSEPVEQKTGVTVLVLGEGNNVNGNST